MDRVIVIIIFLILTAIFGGFLGRFFDRPDIGDLIGNSVAGLIGAIIIFILICYGIGTLRLRGIQKKESKEAAAGSADDTNTRQS